MYKRERKNSSECNVENDKIKKARIEPLCTITEQISNRSSRTEQFSSDKQLHEKYFQEVYMECDNNENNVEKLEDSIQSTELHQAFKYNSICDRDRRRHMYF